MPACMQNTPEFQVQNNSRFTLTAALACPGVGFCLEKRNWSESQLNNFLEVHMLCMPLKVMLLK